MGAVDRSDMMYSTECEKKHLAMLNAHALYQTQNPEKVPLADFQLKIIRQLIERYNTPERNQQKIKPMTKNPERLTGRHFSALVPHNKVRRCIVCSQTKLQAKKEASLGTVWKM
ncbi:hypothetical protein NQ317_004828 [Molorchus minor]|uniref:Uncharacterized protein n=1 Tax=Molorchus minor TaxID=1323400 RepID=A0ABQ9IU98_9CUCU|nr:hypothetical protein NQ317_004828 [Molorchus minor]